MCTGAETALLAAATEAAPIAATAATTAATALPTIAPVVAETGLGALMSGAGAAGTELAAPVLADAAGATLAASEAAPMTMAAAEAAPTTLSAANAGVLPELSSIGPAQGSVLEPGLQASGAQTAAVTTPNVTGAQSTFLGMTPAQWQQQLITQGGSAALQTLGAMQSQKAQQDTADSYQQGLSEFEKSQMAAVEEGLKGFTPDSIAANRKKYSDQMISEYDQNAPQRESFGNILLASTPDEVKQDYLKKQAESNAFARNQYSKSVDLTSLGRAMTAGAQGMQDALTKANMNKGVISSYMATLPGAMASAGGSGSLYSGLGNLTSSLGNVLLASQKASGKSPSSALDIR